MKESVNNDWRKSHYKIMKEFLEEINSKTSDFVLKGGTALLMCYNLDRFSEDIDLDSTNKNIKKYIDNFCKKNNFQYNIAKDTDTVKRFKIHYGDDNRFLKIEVSYRRKELNNITTINGIKVYDINQLAIMKAAAYTGRDKIRDFYDICFICKNYFEELHQDVKNVIANAIEYKGIEQYDYIVKEQQDDLIDEKKLLTDFLIVCDKLGIFAYDNKDNN